MKQYPRRARALRPAAFAHAFAFALGVWFATFAPCAGAGARGDEPKADADISQKQQEALLLWRAGEFERAIQTSTELYEAHPGDRRGRAMFFHIGNQLENVAIPEAETPAKAQEVLKRALDYYRRAAELPGQEKNTRRRSLERIGAIEAKLKTLVAALQRRMPLRETAPMIGGMEAARAAAAFVRENLPAAPPEDRDLATFLLLVYELQFAEDMNHNLIEAFNQFGAGEATGAGGRAELRNGAVDRYAPLVMEAARELQSRGAEAAEQFPRSPRLPEFHYHAAQGHLYEIYADLALRDKALANGRAEEAKSLATKAAQQAPKIAAHAREMGRVATAVALLSATDAPLLGRAPVETFHARRFHKLAGDTLAGVKALLWGIASGASLRDAAAAP